MLAGGGGGGLAVMAFTGVFWVWIPHVCRFDAVYTWPRAWGSRLYLCCTCFSAVDSSILVSVVRQQRREFFLSSLKDRCPAME